MKIAIAFDQQCCVVQKVNLVQGASEQKQIDLNTQNKKKGLQRTRLSVVKYKLDPTLIEEDDKKVGSE